MIRIKLFSYGFDLKAAAVDAQTLLDCDRLLSSTRGERAALDRRQLMTMLFQMCHFAETVCLHDQVVIPEYHTDAERQQRVSYHNLSTAAMNTDLAHALMTQGVLAPLSMLTIDDIQISRLFEKWNRTTLLLRRTLSNMQIAPPSQKQIEVLLSGLLVEELTGAPYYPSVDLLPYYLPTSGLVADMQAYSLLLEAYLKMRQGAAARARIRASLGAVRELSLPPIMTLILSRASDVRSLIPVLLEVRHELTPLREKMSALSELASAEISPEKWERELHKLQQSIDDIASSFGGHSGGRRSLSMLSVSDIAGQIKADSAYSGISADGAVQLSVGKLMSLGVEMISSMIRKRRLRPLPMMARTLAQLPPMGDKISALLGVDFTIRDLTVLEQIGSPYESLWKHVAEVVSARKTALISYACPDPREHRKGADALQHMQSVDYDFLLKAFNITSRAKYDPTYRRGDYLLDVGFVLLSHKRSAHAIRIFENVNREYPDLAEGYYGLGLAHRDIGEPQKAKDLLLRAVSLGAETSEIFNDIGTILMAMKEWPEAVMYLTRAVGMNPDSIAATCNLSSCLRKMGDPDGAAQVLEHLVTTEVSDYRLFECLGYARLDLSLYDLAEEALLRATAEAIDASSAWLGLAQAQSAQCKRVEAEVSFRQALRHSYTDDMRKSALVFWVSFLLSLGDMQAAAEALPELIRLDPENPLHYFTLGAALVGGDKREEAVTPLQEAIKRDHSNVDAALLLARLQLDLQRPQDATMTLEQIRDYAAHSPEYHTMVANLYLNSGDLPAAIDAYERAARVGTVEPQVMYNAAVALDRMQEYGSAIRLYQLELRTNPNFAECHANIAADLCEIGRPADALASAHAAVQLSPGDMTNLNTLIVACYLSGDIKGAVAASRKLLALPRRAGDNDYREQAKNVIKECGAREEQP